MAETLLQVRDLKKYFKTPGGMLHAVDGITFDLEEGKTLGVVGESGCGKSLGRVILGLLDATSGSVLFEGKETIGVSKHQRKDLRKNMQIIFQDPFSSLNPRMCVSELIAEPLKVYGVCKTKEERDKFIVCDEPVSALDVSIQAQILNLLQDLQEQQGLTYIFITHDLSVVKHISDDILVMYVGSMVEKCPADDMFERQLHPYTKGLLSAIPIPNIDLEKKRIILQGEISSPIDPKPGCRFAKRCPYATDRCRSETPAWEEVLPKHFAACHHVREINDL